MTFCSLTKTPSGRSEISNPRSRKKTRSKANTAGHDCFGGRSQATAMIRISKTAEPTADMFLFMVSLLDYGVGVTEFAASAMIEGIQPTDRTSLRATSARFIGVVGVLAGVVFGAESFDYQMAAHP